MSLTNLMRFWRLHPVTRGRQVEAAARFAKWQIVSRIHKGKVVVPFVNKSRLMVSKGQTALTGNVYFGLFEMAEMSFLLHLLRPRDVFVDVGANYGSFSILASAVVGAKSIAFEPVETTVAGMRDQIRLNDVSNLVDVRVKALGAEPGTVKFFQNREVVNRVVVDGDPLDAVAEVPQSTLDIELQGLDPVLIKMDVEGYEYAVLKGARETLAKPSLLAMIMECHDGVTTYGVDRGALRKIVEDAGFQPFTYDPITRTLTPAQFDTAQPLSDNVLMIRDIDAVRARVSSAEQFEVWNRKF